MRRFPSAPAARTVAVLSVICGAVALWFATTRSPATRYLAADGAAEWIVYPRPASSDLRPVVSLPASFRREVALEVVPRSAELRVRAFEDVTARVNGAVVPLSPAAGWKDVRSADVAPLLRRGSNLVDVEVRAARGPPALWLTLEAGGAAVTSGPAWQVSLAGAAWRPAWRASEPIPARRFDPYGRVPRVWDAVQTLLPSLAAVAVVALLAVAAARRWARSARGAALRERIARHSGALVLAAVGLAWLAVFVGSARWLPRVGFDASEHLAYIDHVIRNRSLPLADQGWQMFQPPLYYAAAAAVLGAASLSTSDAGAIWVLRGLGLAIGLATLLMVGATVARLYPGSRSRRALAVAFAGALPCMLLLHQFPTNEIAACCLATATLLAMLRVVGGETTPVRGHALVGALLGGALLAKFSTLLLVPIVLGGLVAHALTADRGPPRARFAPLGVAVVTMIAVCGWHYVRVWLRFGDPFVGGWALGRGFDWWQDPGVRTADHYVRLGGVFSAPLFAGYESFWDGLYSTLWGDGLMSGASGVSWLSPWWSPEWMSAGLALAIVPSLAVLWGAVTETVAWIRRPGIASTVLLAAVVAVGIALAVMTLRIPSIASDKAFYGLIAIAPLAALAARGLDDLARRRWIGPPAVALFCTWAVAAFVAYRVDGDAPRTSAFRVASVLREDPRQALRILVDAVDRDPGDGTLRLLLANLLLQTGESRAAIEPLLQRPGDDDVARSVARATLRLREGDAQGALVDAERAVSLDPDLVEAQAFRAISLEALGSDAAALDAWREVLRINPWDVTAHRSLSRLLLARGDPGGAAAQESYASAIAGAVGRR